MPSRPTKKAIAFAAALIALGAISPAVPAKKVTIRWWLDHAPQELPLFKQVAKAFEAQNPDVKVEISNLWGGTYYDKLMAAGAAGTLPDVYYMRGASGDARFYARGFSMDLTPFVKKDSASINVGDFIDAQLDELKFKGKWMALPYDYSTEGIYYNKTLFSQAGVAPFGDTVTWPEIVAAGLKVTKTGANGKHTQTAFNTVPLPGAQWMEGAMLSEGARMFDDKLTKCLLDSTESMKFFSFISDLIHKQSIAPRPIDPIPWDGFFSKKAAMMIDGSWDTIYMRSMAKFPFDVTSLPSTNPAKQITSATGGSWTISKATKNPSQCWKFIKFVTSIDSTRTLIVTPVRSLPSRKSLLPEWSRNIKKEGLDPKNADVFWLGLQKAGKNSPLLPFDYQVPLNNLVNGLREGKKSVDQLCKLAAQQMNLELDKAHKRKLL